MGLIIKGKEYPDVTCHNCKKTFKDYMNSKITKEDSEEFGWPEGVYICLDCFLEKEEKDDEKNPAMIKAENGNLYRVVKNGESFIVNTSNRKAFVMRNEYTILLNETTLKVVCVRTHQDQKKSCFGGFGFDPVEK